LLTNLVKMYFTDLERYTFFSQSNYKAKNKKSGIFWKKDDVVRSGSNSKMDLHGFASKYKKVIINLQEVLNLEQTVISKKVT